MKYKLLALDIDSTIVKDGQLESSPRVYDAIQKASKKINISLVTARSKTDSFVMVKHLKLESSFHAIENGAKIVNPNGEVEYDLHIPHSEVQNILNVSKEYYEEVGFCIDSHWNNDMEDPKDQIVNGLSFICHKPENAFIVAAEIEKLENKYAVYPGRHWSNLNWGCVLIFNKDATKGKGMGYIQRKLDIKVEETIAVGDGSTDTSMFEYAGLKVAMGNAEQVLKDKADIIAPSVYEDGLAEIIEKYILQNNQE
jgi:hypothetical protein